MSRLDLVNDVGVLASLPPGARTAAANGSGVDLAGYDGAAVVVSSGTVTDGTLYTFEVQESDNNSDFTAVADADLIGSEPTFTASEDNTVKKVGYKGVKRYIRAALVTVTGSPSTGGVFAAYVVRGKSRVSPVT